MEPMSQYGSAYAGGLESVDRRARFITRTYNHLFGAIVAFALIEIALFKSGVAALIAQSMMGVSWLLVLGAFMLVGWGASHAAHRATSSAVQYAGLAAFVLFEAIIFVPLLYIAEMRAPGVISSAALVTFAGFACLTGIVFYTRKDFSFLRGLLLWGGIGAMLIIAAGILFGFQLGTFFSVAMVLFAGASILYDTSNVLHHFPEDRHVGAALELFSSAALMFWYVLRLFIASRE